MILPVDHRAQYGKMMEEGWAEPDVEPGWTRILKLQTSGRIFMTGLPGATAWSGTGVPCEPSFPQLQAVVVQVMVEAASPRAEREHTRKVLETIWAERQALGLRGRSKKEIDAEMAPPLS